MEDFRQRRKEAAQAAGEQPGLEWAFKVDGRLTKTGHDRDHTTRHGSTTCIGDIGFADDTAIIGMANEAHRAEQILVQTMLDWKEKVHPGKTEGLRLSGQKKTL